MIRRILLAGLALGPVVIALHHLTDLGDTALFVLSALALIPLAWLIGEATEHASEHTGPGIGGFLNATFGNAPELIIALIAVHDGLTDVVRGSLTGSVVGNLLLVLGFSLFAGGAGAIERWSSFLSFGMIALAIGLFLIPSVAELEQRLRRPARRRSLRAGRRSRSSSCTPRHRLHAPAPPPACTSSSDDEIDAWSFKAVARDAGRRHRGDGTRRRDPRRLARDVRRRRRAVGLLRRRRDRRDRRERGRARRCRDRRLPRQDQARGRDRAVVVGPGGGVPRPGRGSALVADRAAGARVPEGRDRRPRGVARRRDGDHLGRSLVAAARRRS